MSPATSLPTSEHFRLEEVADGLFVAVATARGYALCNVAIVDLGGATLLFDAGLTPQAGAALAHAAEHLLGRPVDLLVNSHYHGDHIRGNAAIRARHVVSTRRVRELIEERAGPHLASDRLEAAQELERLRSGAWAVEGREREVYEGWFEGILATPAGLEMRAPDLTFVSELRVHGRRRTARLLSLGGGHSPSDVLLYLEEERFACLGDLLSIGFHPYLADGEPSELRRILGAARALPIDRAMPGHGPLGTDKDLGEMARYVEQLEAGAAAARAEGLTAEAFAERSPVAPFDRWLFRPIYEQNARFVFGAVAGGSTGA